MLQQRDGATPIRSGLIGLWPAVEIGAKFCLFVVNAPLSPAASSSSPAAFGPGAVPVLSEPITRSNCLFAAFMRPPNDSIWPQNALRGCDETFPGTSSRRAGARRCLPRQGQAARNHGGFDARAGGKDGTTVERRPVSAVVGRRSRLRRRAGQGSGRRSLYAQRRRGLRATAAGASKVRFWQERDDAVVVFSRDGIDDLVTFAVADGVAYESFRPASALISVVAVD